jgi:hypothetical protein
MDFAEAFFAHAVLFSLLLSRPQNSAYFELAFSPKNFDIPAHEQRTHWRSDQ